ncbi:tyrosine-protein kinase Btk29A [Eurytemora carolleeae]|uniref:tyrosine-protein kinase Btk29A n=1 Tax=Eurytemora carolleeae TaxID=1294199 RepID=UPI000C773CB3|nr:tyrosine-protein kinase Btk29A [Eurytemora carolleeae]|eukprot:XP_023331198.1 tyrosine-protein kinase Btk29A-like [Eurytemora affinis]
MRDERSRMGKMSLQGSQDEILKHSWMTKRSQLKSRISWTNYKDRWFCLTRTSLAYYDGDEESKRKEKGRIYIRDIKLVENVRIEDRPQSFQIKYTESGQDYTLYIQSKGDAEREEWIILLRNLIRHNPALCDNFHPELWSSKWLCCGEPNKNVLGCQPISWIPRPTKSDPAPPLPLSDPLLSPDSPGPPERLIVVAVYPFTAIEPGDLSLIKGEQYIVLDDSQDHWWQVENSSAEVGFIPSNYVKKFDELGLTSFDWYVGDMSRQRAESLLKTEDKEGCFVVRNSSTKGLYTLSLFTKIPHNQVKHYHIKQNIAGYFLSEKHCCQSIAKLIEYHSHNAGGLACRLKCPPGRSKPPTAGLSHGKWEIDPTELTLGEELGSGQFGVVRRGKWKGTIDVAVKMMKEGTMSEDDFIEEAKVMTKMQHQNLVQLYGVCSKNRPIFIVTEYMKHGSLLSFLRKLKPSLYTDPCTLLDFALQVSRGMAYLERHNYIHRDLAARNCLVGAENVVKVADFGLARYVIDDQYTSNGGAKFPIKWSPPEVLNFTRFSSKSDVWAYGVLCWEVFTCGEMPYGRAKNPEVVERVQRGQILSQPAACPNQVYEVMRLCWAAIPDDRPSFRTIKEQLTNIVQLIQID